MLRPVFSFLFEVLQPKPRFREYCLLATIWAGSFLRIDHEVTCNILWLDVCPEMMTSRQSWERKEKGKLHRCHLCHLSSSDSTHTHTHNTHMHVHTHKHVQAYSEKVIYDILFLICRNIFLFPQVLKTAVPLTIPKMTVWSQFTE